MNRTQSLSLSTERRERSMGVLGTSARRGRVAAPLARLDPGGEREKRACVGPCRAPDR